MKVVYAGGPCTCGPDRYVRFAIPHGVAGAAAMISCQHYDEATHRTVKEHAFPTDAEYALRVPGVS